MNKDQPADDSISTNIAVGRCKVLEFWDYRVWRHLDCKKLKFFKKCCLGRKQLREAAFIRDSLEKICLN